MGHDIQGVRNRSSRRARYIAYAGVLVVLAGVTTAHSTRVGEPVPIVFEPNTVLQIVSTAVGLMVFYYKVAQKLREEIAGLDKRLTRLETKTETLYDWWEKRMERREIES